MFRVFAKFRDVDGTTVAVRADRVVGVFVQLSDESPMPLTVIITDNGEPGESDYVNTEWKVTNTFDEVLKELELCLS